MRQGDYLWGHERRGAHLLGVHRALWDMHSEAKARQLGLGRLAQKPAGRKQDALRLHIPVADGFGMQVGEALEDLRHEVRHFGLPRGPCLKQGLIQGAARAVLHYEIASLGRLGKIIELNEARVYARLPCDLLQHFHLSGDPASRHMQQLHLPLVQGLQSNSRAQALQVRKPNGDEGTLADGGAVAGDIAQLVHISMSGRAGQRQK
mmetsp:Transcript_131983/g.282281  ORF Transcript_131983/g.282281 Transcript_131983/m.282281 type:complete len:206 (-) Transcript_131983:311-928(-)